MSFKDVSNSQVLLDTLFQLRVGAGLTQQELAQRLKIPQSTISKVESGQRKIDLVELKIWCEAAGFTLVDFVKKFENNINEKR